MHGLSDQRPRYIEEFGNFWFMKGNIKDNRFPNFLESFLTMCIYDGKWRF